MFFILCSYLSWVSVKENEENSDSIPPRRRACANPVPVSDAAHSIVSTAFLLPCARGWWSFRGNIRSGR